jgi:hypothetical protein
MKHIRLGEKVTGEKKLMKSFSGVQGAAFSKKPPGRRRQPPYILGGRGVERWGSGGGAHRLPPWGGCEGGTNHSAFKP